jgi:hypothetical protein
MKIMNTILNIHGACDEGKEWARDKSFEEVYNTCYRGDWLLWLFHKTMNKDEANAKLLATVKARITFMVKDLVVSDAVRDAIDAGFKYANGEVGADVLEMHRKIVHREAFGDRGGYADYAVLRMLDLSCASSVADNAVYALSLNSNITGCDIATVHRIMANMVRDILPIEVWHHSLKY